MVQEWKATVTGSRFEELDSDDESVSSQLYAQYRGYEGPSRTQRIPAHVFADLAYGEELEPDDGYNRGAEWQMAMREKEEELAERALRRIRRARLRGDSNVDLSREELDALERRRRRDELEQRPPPVRGTQPARQQTLPSKSKPKRKGSGGMFGMGSSPKSKNVKADRRIANFPLQDAEPRPQHQHQLPPASSSSSLYKLANKDSPRASRRNSKTRLKQPPLPPFYDIPATSNYRPSSSRSARRGDGSPTRSLPDDPDWQPRSRSSSSLQQAQTSPDDRLADPFIFQQYGQGPDNRRIVSDPIPENVQYGSLRRNPPRGGQFRGTTGRYREVIDLSDEDEDELGASDDSDEGVRVDVVPGSKGDYHVQQAQANAGLARARKGKGR